MSLRVDDRSGRSRSKSPGGDRDRSRSRSNVRPSAAPAAPTQATKVTYDTVVTSPKYEIRSPTSAGAERSGFFGQPAAAPYVPTTTAPSYPPPPSAPYAPAPPGAPYPQENGGFTMGGYTDFPPHERPGYVGPQRSGTDEGLAYGNVTSPGTSRNNSYGPYPPQTGSQQQYPYNNGDPASANSRSSSYTYQYAQPPEKITYTAKPISEAQYRQTLPGQFPDQVPSTYTHNAYDQNAHVVDITPYDSRGGNPAKNRLSLDTRGAGVTAPRSPGLPARLNTLSVGGPGAPGDLPPPSPLLEAYRGTYQQMSPMPLALRPDDDELSEFEALSPTISRSGKRSGGVKFSEEAVKEKEKEKQKKRVSVYHPEEDAQILSKALSHHHVDTETICEILPPLSHDQIMYLRKEYKKQVKVQGKGVNLSKHLKTKTTGNFGKAVYVTALGRWESEGYWANFFYQSHNSRYELLIESLMGRSNGEIWNIKDEFKDKRYSDDLEKCMEKELKMDKFRTAVLMVLEERRQEEQDVLPIEYRNQDLQRLYKALHAPKGGESTMLEIIVLRSDAHLREVLKAYEGMYQENFARAALQKSNNLVGEVIAHVLNGVINKPARDARLLRHAIEDIADKNKDEELRYELLISRVIRLHWDRLHLMRVKKQYQSAYKKTLEEDIRDATKGDFADFMCELCQTK